MDFHFDPYYSDVSTPRTPSPRTSVSSDDVHYSSPAFKSVDSIHIAPAIYEHNDEHGIQPEPHAIKAAAYMHNAHYNAPYPPPPGSRGSLLEELYDHEIPEQHHMHQDMYHHEPPQYHHHPHARHQGTWPLAQQTVHNDHIASMRHPHDIPMTRRATFPYVRPDGREHLSYNQPFMGDTPSPYGSRPGSMYGEPMPMDMAPHHMDEPFAHQVPLTASPHAPLYDMIKTEDTPVIVPSQAGYCRPPSAGMHGLPCLQPHAGLLVQHTDDAASKETQYLRRRCFNCHTTEPPSWRRSTLNPGKIVCNKCGLYERTHLRPRPLRFDELRAGSKTRKQPKAAAGSPKVGKLSPVVKKEARDSAEPTTGTPQRRASVSSSNGSAPSSVNGGSSDWDDSGEFFFLLTRVARVTKMESPQSPCRLGHYLRPPSTRPPSRPSPSLVTRNRSRHRSPRATAAFACPTRRSPTSLRSTTRLSSAQQAPPVDRLRHHERLRTDTMTGRTARHSLRRFPRSLAGKAFPSRTWRRRSPSREATPSGKLSRLRRLGLALHTPFALLR